MMPELSYHKYGYSGKCPLCGSDVRTLQSNDWVTDPKFLRTFAYVTCTDNMCPFYGPMFYAEWPKEARHDL